MIVFVNDKSEIHDVNTTEDVSLTPLYVDENNPTFPFKGWSVAKICCYKVTVVEGVVTMMTPYYPSSALDYIDELGMGLDILLGRTEVSV